MVLNILKESIMKKRAIFVLGIMFVFSGFVIAQTKTVTNADLEKFRQKRLKAEKDLRENYAQMGFPSPEELKRRNEESQRELSELSNILREKRLERESREAKNNTYYYRQNNRNPNRTNNGFIDYGSYSTPIYSYGQYRNRRYKYNQFPNRRFRRKSDFRQQFIRSMPNYVLQNHRFNRIDTNRNIRPNRQVRRGGLRSNR